MSLSVTAPAEAGPNEAAGFRFGPSVRLPRCEAI